MLAASRTEARNRFEMNRGLDPHSEEYAQALEEAQGVATVLRQNVVQGASAEGDKFSMLWQYAGQTSLTAADLRIHEETEKGDNDSVKQSPQGTLGGQKCCSS
jgi:complex III assembly factor LYRM7